MSQDLIKALEHCENMLMRHSIDAVNGGAIEDEALNTIRSALSRHRSSVESVELPEGEAVAWRDDGQQAANGPLHLCYRVVTSETLASMPRAAAAAYTEALYTASTVRSRIAAAVEKEKAAWRASLAPVFSERMGAEQVREKVQAAIRARGEKP